MKDVLVLMGASRENGTMKEYLQQLKDADIDTHVWSIDDWSKSGTLGFQVEKYIELAHQFKDYKYLIFTDAWDVTFYGSKADVLAKMPDIEVLWAAERNCFPDPSLAPKMKGTTPWRFVNGGMMCGTPELIHDFFVQIQKAPGYNPDLLNQGYFNTLRFNDSDLIHIDTHTHLFYTLYLEGEELQFEKGLPVNTLLGTKPNFIHANGNWPTEHIIQRRKNSLTQVPDKNMLGHVSLIIGLPFCGRPVAPAWAICLATQNFPLNTNRVIHATNGKEIGLARNEIAENAIKAGAKYLWFLDDDVSPPATAAKSLITTLENSDSKTMVAAGVYCAKSYPTEPVVFRADGKGAFWKWKVGDVFEVASIGTGCMMINLEVFKYLEKPWFKTVDEPETATTPCVQVTDDIYFCQKVRAAGFKIVCDANVLTTHWDWDSDKKEFKPYFLFEDCYPLRPVSDTEPRAKREL